MGLIDDIVNAFVDLIEFFDFNVGEISRSFERAEDPTEALALVLQTVQPIDEVGDILVDLSEEFVLAPITEEGEITPENVESVQDEIEGNAAAITAGILGDGRLHRPLSRQGLWVVGRPRHVWDGPGPKHAV